MQQTDKFNGSDDAMGCRWDPDDPSLCFEADACGCFMDPCTHFGLDPEECIQDPCEGCCTVFEQC